MLEWKWEFDEHIKFFKAKQEIGLPTPLDDVPALDRFQQGLWNDFIRISSGNGRQPITFSEMDAYSRMFGITDKEIFVSVVQAMWLKRLELSNGN